MSVNEHEMQIINDAFNSENNLISRQAVLEQTYLWSKDEFLRVTNPFDYLRKRINDISSVKPQEPKWISVSERLPEKEGRYLTTILNEYDNRLRYIMTCDYFPNGCWCPDEECASSNVIAWMPLPEPYKAESEE